MSIPRSACSEAPPAPSRLRGWLAVARRLPWLPLLVLLTVLASALFAEWLAPHSPYAMSLPKKLLPPLWLDGGTTAHLLGTDSLGRDLLSRIVYGSRVSLLVAVVALSIGALVGTIPGIVAGYFGGLLDSLIMRVCDAFLSFPIILIAMVLAVGLGASIGVIVLAVVLVVWARFARMARGEVLSWRERDFVRYAQMVGVRPSWILLRHIAPNILNTMVVLYTLMIAWVILVEASLSYLGAGVPPPTPSWGGMIAQGRDHIGTAWWVTLFPGLAIVFTCLSLNLFGDWLQATVDPRQRQV